MLTNLNVKSAAVNMPGTGVQKIRQFAALLPRALAAPPDSGHDAAAGLGGEKRAPIGKNLHRRKRKHGKALWSPAAPQKNPARTFSGGNVFVRVEGEGMVGRTAEGKRRRAKGRGQTADGRRQKADGRRQKAEGRGQRGDGRRQTADGRRQKAEGRGETAEGRRQRAKGKRQKAKGRRAEGRGK